jgi:hypothetical protein
MSKRLIPFDYPRAWENNPNCLMCNSTDKLYNKVLNEDDEYQIRKTLEFLDEYCVVNGYEALKTFEKNGFKENKLKEISTFKTIRYSDDANDKARLIHSRWCIMCGSRKPDIYDESREINE